MATVQKAISESSSYTTRTLTTTISAPGIRQDAEISVSPNIDASKVSYVIDEVAETIKVTLTNAGYTSQSTDTQTYNLISQVDTPNPDGSTSIACYYGAVTYHWTVPAGAPGRCAPTYDYSTHTYDFNYIITVIYSVKTFPELKVRQGGQLKTAADGWVRVNGQLRQIQQIWVRSGGQLKEV